MKALLTEISIDSSSNFSEEQLPVLKKYLPTAQFKTFDTFKPYDYDKRTEDEQLKVQTDFEEYKLKPLKELSGYSHDFVCDLHLFMHDFPNVPFRVKGTREVTVDATNSDALNQHQKAVDLMLQAQETRLNSMMEMFVKMSENIANNFKVDTFNQKCDVHIGGGLLMTVNETLLMEDSCTDVLQRELNSGWRILAVNVQNDGRRPDYVLGRYNPNLQIDGEALRK